MALKSSGGIGKFQGHQSGKHCVKSITKNITSLTYAKRRKLNKDQLHLFWKKSCSLPECFTFIVPPVALYV